MQESQMVQKYACNFVKKGHLTVLSIFGKSYTLDKHFKHGFKLFGPIFFIIHYILWTPFFVALMLNMQLDDI